MAEVSAWERLREYAASQSGVFTSQEVISWFRRHAPRTVADGTVRAHVRGACWNVGDRSQFSVREPFLTRVDRGVFRRATGEELAAWRAGRPDILSLADTSPAEAGSLVTDSLTGTEPAVLTESASALGGTVAEPVAQEWHTEAKVQSLLVRHLVTDGWSILSVANTATKEHGIDVVATRDGVTVGVEVKGYPSTRYADPARAAETKKTSPSTQAGHWYAQAILAAMRLRSRHPDYTSVIALPDFPRYRALHAETEGSLEAAGILVWWVSKDGTVRER